jgi:hypothetical protein
MFTRFVPLGVYGLDLILAMVWAGVVINEASIIVTIKWGITTKYSDICSTLKLEVLAYVTPTLL